MEYSDPTTYEPRSDLDSLQPPLRLDRRGFVKTSLGKQAVRGAVDEGIHHPAALIQPGRVAQARVPSGMARR